MTPDMEKPKKKWPYILTAIFFIFFLIIISAYFTFEKIYENRIYPGVYLGNIDLSKKTRQEALDIINEKIKKLEREGIKVSYDKHITHINPTISFFSGDSAYQIMDFYEDRTIDSALALGRSSDFLTNLKQKINTAIYSRQINLIYSINEEEIIKVLYENYKDLEMPAENAKLVYEKKGDVISFDIEKEKFGKTLDFKKAISDLRYNLENLYLLEISIESETGYPEIYENECINIESKAQQIISNAPITLIATTSQKIYNQEKVITKKQILDKEKIAGSLILSKDENNNDKKIIINIDENAIKNSLEEFAKEIDVVPENEKFEIQDGKVVQFQQAKDGWSLDIDVNIAKIQNDFLNNASSTIELSVSKITSAFGEDSSNDFGIKEIIGIGHSNFVGSPSNRRHNIQTGASAVDGLLLAPGDEFSLVKALGEINEDTGYLPELVIKGNKTIPEYGGGLCQIATTLFRAALNSGLEITARRNHSYRVSYYEPAGTDAAVYDPWPDIRFINNTDKHILIQKRFDGNDLYFDFWGTEDGRIAETTDPVIYNITKPGPTKEIETLDLPVGEKKCTEHAHNGADAYFDYTVTYANGEIHEERFSSHYVPWQEVCLIGVEKLSTDTSTSTEEISEDTTTN